MRLYLSLKSFPVGSYETNFFSNFEGLNESPKKTVSAFNHSAITSTFGKVADKPTIRQFGLINLILVITASNVGPLPTSDNK